MWKAGTSGMRDRRINHKGSCGTRHLNAEGKREGLAQQPAAAVWPLGDAGLLEEAEVVLVAVDCPWAAVPRVTMFFPPPPALSPHPIPRSPPICTRTTTTCGLSRNIIWTQVMCSAADTSCSCLHAALRRFSCLRGSLNFQSTSPDLAYAFKNYSCVSTLFQV